MSRAAAPAGPGGGLPRSREQRFLYTVRERESGERAGGLRVGHHSQRKGPGRSGTAVPTVPEGVSGSVSLPL